MNIKHANTALSRLNNPFAPPGTPLGLEAQKQKMAPPVRQFASGCLFATMCCSIVTISILGSHPRYTQVNPAAEKLTFVEMFISQNRLAILAGSGFLFASLFIIGAVKQIFLKDWYGALILSIISACMCMASYSLLILS